MIKFIFKKFLTEFATFQMIFKWCNRLQYIGNWLPVYLNVKIQIPLWRVTSFHKMHCVIDYIIMIIDYQWQVLNKRSKKCNSWHDFLKVINFSMVFLTRHEECIKARPWLAFIRSSWTSFEKPLNLYNLYKSLRILFYSSFFFFLCQKTF